MILILCLLVVVGAVGLLAAWLGENPGTVTMTWFDVQIETNVAVLLLFTALAVVMCIFCYHVLARIVLAPLRFSERQNLKYYQQAIAEITYSVAALAASDMASAAEHTRKAEKLLGTTPLTLLLRAQISKNEGSDAETRALLEQLLEYKETEYLAATSLADVAQKQAELPKALLLARRAHRVNPKESLGAWAVFDLLLRDGQLQEAEIHIQHSRKTRAFSRADVRAARGKLALRQAEIASASLQKEQALALAEQAVRGLPGNIAAAELAAGLAIETNRPARALKLIQAQWKIDPSTKLAELFNTATSNWKPAKKEAMIERLRASNGGNALNVLLNRGS